MSSIMPSFRVLLCIPTKPVISCPLGPETALFPLLHRTVDRVVGKTFSRQKCVDLLAFRGIRFFRVVIFLSQKSEDLGRLVHLHILKDHLHQIVADAFLAEVKFHLADALFVVVFLHIPPCVVLIVQIPVVFQKKNRIFNRGWRKPLFRQLLAHFIFCFSGKLKIVETFVPRLPELLRNRISIRTGIHFLLPVLFLLPFFHLCFPVRTAFPSQASF